jgi:hypothetical protein
MSRCYAPRKMDIKSEPNRQIYVAALRRMTPEQRLSTAFELGDFTRALLRDGLRARFPEATDEQLQAIYLERLDKCHNRRS